jgi:hypothetical protein
MQKRQTLEKGFALFKNDITTFLKLCRPLIYSSNQKLDNKKAGPLLTLPEGMTPQMRLFFRRK